ncbi:hypothetical protein GALMADRAFT_141030 [Galerina marginata CBS 339.88]|uniref:Uncharacterized protein n=1 Tax=Galerina marginata (strain CBS 339.88) TaxID=685588 RepID=A0A067T6M8_GALM3|nr:hypothetical protein GALMADRAFT_141030 [Galerina marginata CBS 339.88]
MSATAPTTQMISRPANAGAQNLPSMLKISEETFAAVKETIHTLAKKNLNVALPLKNQTADSLKVVTASQQHQLLRSYEQDWVTLEILRRFLKNSSSRARKREQVEKV